MPIENTELSTEKQLRKYYSNLLFMLAAPALMAWYYYGTRALLLLTVCMVSSAVFSFFGTVFTQPRVKPPYDYSAFFTGAVIALMLPAYFSLPLAIAGCAFAIIVAKMPFGTTHKAPFVPAAAGFAFLSVCWPEQVFSYPELLDKIDLFSFAKLPGSAGSSLAAMIQVGNSVRLSHINVFHILTGSIPGPMGTGVILILIAAAFYFLFTRPSALLNTIGFLFTCATIALVFTRVESESLSLFVRSIFSGSFKWMNSGRVASVFLELCSGSLIFVALFLLTADTAESPQKPLPRLAYGIFTGILCMGMRHFGAYEQGACFAILLANAVWPFAGIRVERLRTSFVKKPAKTPAAQVEAHTGGVADV
ncbi:MAG TPA: RnfABCDGE type electron transport complex subunit D [Clostridia bacterium]|nr:RnfABCDGE type electron transport complex subunit D [Clostridia bacterium]